MSHTLCNIVHFGARERTLHLSVTFISMKLQHVTYFFPPLSVSSSRVRSINTRGVHDGVPVHPPLEETRDSPGAIRVYAKRYRAIRINPRHPGLSCV